MISTSRLFDFYSDKKVLVCGASGNAGHHIFDFVHEQCADTIGTCLHRRGKFDGSNADSFLPVDFADDLAAYYFFKDKKFDYVFICCAQTYNAAMCESNPQSMVLPNIQMTSNILRECLRTGVKRVLFVSSATVYQPSYKVLAEEDLDLNKDPHGLYMGVGWVKRYLEQLCKFYHGLGLEVVVVRPTNIYGRYDKTDEKYNHVIPALVLRALRKTEPFPVFGNGAAVKNFIHANNFARDCAKVMAGYKTPDPINLCSDEEYSIEEVVHMLHDICCFRIPGYKLNATFASQEVDKVPYRGISRAKFDALFGREKYKPLKVGLEEMLEWFSLLPQIQNPLTTA